MQKLIILSTLWLSFSAVTSEAPTEELDKSQGTPNNSSNPITKNEYIAPHNQISKPFPRITPAKIISLLPITSKINNPTTHKNK